MWKTFGIIYENVLCNMYKTIQYLCVKKTEFKNCKYTLRKEILGNKNLLFSPTVRYLKIKSIFIYNDERYGRFSRG